MDPVIPPPPPRLIAWPSGMSTVREAVLEQGGNELQVLDIAALFDEDHLESRPIPASKSHLQWPAHPLPRNFRLWFRFHASQLLGWTNRREEGDANGFPDKLNAFLREYWADPVVLQVSSCPACSSPAQNLTAFPHFSNHPYAYQNEVSMLLRGTGSRKSMCHQFYIEEAAL
jgi:hypothetical protein